MGRREDFMAALAPLQGDAVPALHAQIKQLFPTDEAFKRWEDSLWLGLFFARRLTGVLADQPRVEPRSPAGRIQSFLEVAKGNGAFFGPQSLLRDLPLAIRCTCCVRIDGKAFGTGFLVGADLILTNWHVIRAILDPQEQPERISVVFDYLHEAGVGTPPLSVAAIKVMRWRPARQEFLPGAAPSERPLDYAVIRLAAALPSDRGFVDLDTTPELATGSKVIIVGHPNGQPLAVSFSRSIGLHGLDGALAYYDADTLHGSSGSLVLLESQNQLKAALLHAGGKRVDENFGIHLRAIHQDIAGGITRAPISPSKPSPKLESFFGSDPDERAGQLATLLSVLPSDITIDTNASLSQQLQSVETQWDDRFAEALEIARAVAAPASSRAGGTALPSTRDRSAATPPVVTEPAWHPHRSRMLIVMVCVIAFAVAVLLIKSILGLRPDGKTEILTDAPRLMDSQQNPVILPVDAEIDSPAPPADAAVDAKVLSPDGPKRRKVDATEATPWCKNVRVTKYPRAVAVEFRYYCPDENCSGTLRYEPKGTDRTETEILQQYWESRGPCGH